MISSALSFKDKTWYKAILIILIWVIGVAYLVHHYHAGYLNALLDVGSHTFFILIGFFLLENIFRFFTPQEKHFLIFLAFPLILSSLVFFLGKFTLVLFLSENNNYLYFFKEIYLLRVFVIFLIILSYALLLLFHSKLESQIKALERADQMERLAREAELYQLRQQLQPHFLFNSLNSISSLVKRKPEEAREMVLQLSDFLRKTIRKENNRWINVSEELEYLQLFVGIEKLRFGHRLSVNFKIDLECEKFILPQLLVQPLLENAVKHGLYGVLGDVLISVVFEKEDQYLKINISNPFDPEAGQASGEGFGLKAVKRRLFLLFGRHDLLQVKEAKNLFVVELKIPQNYDQYSSH
ncbi:putative regulator of cell autolysis [Belliella baltica DSM 15883]|uniref:Putative regulator of cell autolysis n=1 Tax=Belliella baltica (strain DSM 15883 / CIP 108006 / LMG 21964 / BA134) TaxID=866536 RepID=I3Z0E0_BELBD|nr:histidine kinase [Belliella baltica]AFL82708.1 putative regulator of cell autolysis [Belliella baltica DSM 15883]